MGICIITDLRKSFGPIRDQGPRPTCLAFAASDAHAAARGDPWDPLSCEYAYYRAVKRQGGGPLDGTTVPAMLAVLEQDGQPREADWPYLPTAPIDTSLWQPPAGLNRFYKRKGNYMSGDFGKITRSMDAGIAVIVVMTISRAFFVPTADAIVAGTEPVVPSLLHAVVAVAHATDGVERLILVRNSWGAGWGDRGHAWLAEHYAAPRIVDLAVLKEAA